MIAAVSRQLTQRENLKWRREFVNRAANFTRHPPRRHSLYTLCTPSCTFRAWNKNGLCFIMYFQRNYCRVLRISIRAEIKDKTHGMRYSGMRSSFCVRDGVVQIPGINLTKYTFQRVITGIYTHGAHATGLLIIDMRCWLRLYSLLNVSRRHSKSSHTMLRDVTLTEKFDCIGNFIAMRRDTTWINLSIVIDQDATNLLKNV